MNDRARRKATETGPKRRPGAAGAAPLAAAMRHHQAGRLDQAEALYRRVLAKTPAHPEALRALSMLEHERGRNDRALSLIERALALRPLDATCLHHQGEILRALGRHADAVEAYRQALAASPNFGDCRFGLGTALLDLGRAKEAAAELDRAATLLPGDLEVLNNLGNALAEAGQLDGALTRYRQALALRPGYTECAVNLGIALVQAGRDGEAERHLRDAIAGDRGLAQAWRQLGLLLQRTGRAEEAARVLRRAVTLEPGAADLWRELGRALDAAGQPEEAEGALQEAIRLAPKDARMHVELGHVLVELKRFDEALGHYRAAIASAPDLAEAHFNAGLCLQYLGAFEEAATAHRRALTLRPDLAQAHYSLALMARGGTENPDEVGRLEALLARPDLSDEARINASFALARLFDRRGEHDAAFASLRTANALKARLLPFDPRRHTEYLERLIATFDAGFFAGRREFGVSSELPVLIVGMPRSGTSLVEQILASHPLVHGAGEIDDLRRMVRSLPHRLKTATPFPECVADLDRETVAALAHEYLARLHRRGDAALRVTDKLPGNYVRLGLVALLLPGARVIHCRRHPLDTCLSCYFQNFADGLRFTYDLSHLGLAYRGYRLLMGHWRRTLPVRMLDLCYEDLVTDLEAAARRLVAFCGLPWDERCLGFHEQVRPVDTTSFWQVRQPIYATSIGRWRLYRRHLKPLCEMLGPLEADTPSDRV